MVILKLAFVLLITFAITPLDAICRKRSKSPCANGQAALAGYFCGRGPTHQDCPSNYECLIAPNDAYAVCCPQSVTEPPKQTEKPGSCPTKAPGAIGSCIARCSDDSDCPDDLKCCGGCPRECVKPNL